MADPPKSYEDFVARFPALGQAWDLLRQGAREAGPLDERTLALIRIATAAGARREGALRSAVRKALASGVLPAEVEQVIATGASTVGLPATVAAWTWARDELDKEAG